MKKGDKAQIELSFGMIFSIILIIVFIGFAFYAIKLFLSANDSMKTGKFLDNFQNDVDTSWKGFESSQEENYILPTKIEFVCFADFDKIAQGKNSEKLEKLKQAFSGGDSENLIFYPVGSGNGIDGKEILHLNINKTIAMENPFCIQNVKGNIKMTLKKDYGEVLVTITD